MKYGNYIRDIRKHLKITQDELSGINISRNLISSIEKNKTNLIPQKGILIMEKLIEASLEKNVMIDIKFDDLLGHYPRYHQIKEAHKFCKDIYDATLKYDKLEIALLETDIETLSHYDIGLLKFFVYYYSARYLRFYSKELAIKYYFKSLECLKWLYPLEKESIFSTALREVTPLANEYKMYSKLAEYHDLGIITMEQSDNEFSHNHYYNQAYFNMKAGRLKKAKEVITSYLNSKSLDQEDLVDAKLLKADILLLNNHVDEGILLLEECLLLINNSDLHDQHADCLCKLLSTISQRDMKSHYDFIEKYKETLNNLMDQVSRHYDKHKAFHSIALSEAYMNNHERAYLYFEKAYTRDNVCLMKEALHTYKTIEKLAEYDEKLYGIDVNKLDDTDHIEYLNWVLEYKTN